MYRTNDVLIEDHRFSNLFNSNEHIRPIRGLWSMTKVLEYEPLIDETITKFVGKACPEVCRWKDRWNYLPS